MNFEAEVDSMEQGDDDVVSNASLGHVHDVALSFWVSAIPS